MRTIILLGICCISSNIFAQQDWLTTGNSGLTNSNFLGSTDAHDLIFKVKNKERGRLLQNGTWQFGKGTDYASIDSGGILRFSGKAAHLVGPNQFGLICDLFHPHGLFMNGDLDQWEFKDEQLNPYVSISDKTHSIASWGGFRGGKGNDIANIDSLGNLSFSGNGAYILKDGQYAFVCDGARSEGLYMNEALEQWEFRDSLAKPIFTLNNNTGNFSALGAIQLGNAKNNIAGSIRFTGTDFEGYNGNAWRSLTAANNAWLATGNKGSNPSANFIGTTDNQPLIFRTNNNEAMRINGDGKVGIGTNSPGNYSVKINHGSFGLDLANASMGLHWEHFITNTGNMLLYYNAGVNPIGSFNHTSGTYSALSDERMKTNIQPVKNILEKINSLKTVSYNFRSDKEQKQYIGFIAQDVEKIFPSLITHINDERSESYLMDYSGFGVIAIKGIQELQQQNNELKQENDDLRSRLDKLEAFVFSNSAPKQSFQFVELGMQVKLEQNIPNPFNDATTIGYYLPANKGNAFINFYTSGGAILKSVKLISTGKGMINVKANELPSGTYQYALVVDGKVLDTKQMIQVK